MSDLSKRDAAFIITVLLGCVFIAPFGFGLLLLAIAPYLRVRSVLLLGVLLVIYSFFVINTNKIISNDLFWYSQQYYMNYGSSISDVFADYRAGVQARWGEPVYHLLSYFLSNISNANYTVFVFVISFSVYLGSLFSIYFFINKSSLNDSQKAIIIIFFLFFGIIFTQSLHLIRQYLACTLLLFSVVLSFNNREKLGGVFSVLAFLTHNSTLVVSVVLLCVYLIYKYSSNIKIKIRYSLIFSIFLALLYISLFIITGNESRLLIDDGSVSPIVKIIDLLLFIITVIAFNLSKDNSKETELIYLFYISYCVFLFLMHYSHFLSLRYYFFLDFFRWVPCYILFNYIDLKRNSVLPVGLFLVAISVTYFNLRFTTTPFDYQHSFLEYLVYPLF